MSQRSEIPDGNKYRIPGDLQDECAHLIADLVRREFVMRTEGVGNHAACITYSEVFEPVMVDSTIGEEIPSVRVRRELSERISTNQISAGQRIDSESVLTETPSHIFDAYTLEIGNEIGALDLQPSPDFDVHEMYRWTALVTAVIEKRSVSDEVGDLPDDDYAEVISHIIYTDDGSQPDDIELLRLISLLQSILYTARKAAAYEANDIPSSVRLQQLGKLTLRNFGAHDAIVVPCGNCIMADIPCIHVRGGS